MNKKILLSIIIILAIGIIVILFGDQGSKAVSNEATPIQNVEEREGVQYITITARGGYSPKVTNAESGVPTKIVMKTNGTYDCSSSLVIRSIDYKKNLPQTGEEVIDIGVPQAGTSIQGTCSMGMYSFSIHFK